MGLQFSCFLSHRTARDSADILDHVHTYRSPFDCGDERHLNLSDYHFALLVFRASVGESYDTADD